MEHLTINSDIPFKQLFEESAKVEEWEKFKPKNVEFTAMHLFSKKVIKAEGTVTKNNGVVHDCTWNYQGICRDKRTNEVIEEGCL